jgi:predicted MFS family arabinose efflux permease
MTKHVVTPAVAVLLISASGFCGLYLLFPVVPVLAAQDGGRLGAGLATTAFMATTVAVQAMLPRFMGIAPHRLLALSLMLLGVPAAFYAFDPPLLLLLALTALRGAGFGILTVVSTRLVSSYASPGRRGASLGLYGLATSLTGVLAPSFGLVLLSSGKSWVVYALGAALPLAALAALRVVSRRPPPSESAEGTAARNLRQAVRDPSLTRPALLFLPCAIAYGGMYTFLPLASSDAAGGLLVFGLGFAGARFAFGRLADTVPAQRLMVPLLLLAAAGTLATATAQDGLGLVVCTLAAAIGIGGMATVSLVEIMSSVEAQEGGLASVIWNVTFDVGIATGGLGLGIAAQISDYSATFVVSSTGIAAAFVADIVRSGASDRHARRRPGADDVPKDP